MKVELNTDKWMEATERWGSMCRHMAGKATAKADALYYELYLKYFDRLQAATRSGDIIAHNTSVPTELIYAFDLVPLLMTSSVWQMAYSLRNFQECLDISAENGLVEETCSGHRMICAFVFKGWFPPPKAVLYVMSGCDAFAGSPRMLSEMYEVPSFCIDPPYWYNEEGYRYLADELGDAVAFLEQVTGRKMDWNRLKLSMEKSKRQLELLKEICELRKAVPSPMENRRAWQLNWMNWIWAGSDEGILFFETLRDELRERVAQGYGAADPERLRLVELFMPPSHGFKMLEWMQREFGVSIVAESLVRYENVEIDPEQPLYSLARKWCSGPLWNRFQGPSKDVVRGALSLAKEYRADGAIWWDNFACRQCGAVRMTKDALRDELEVPLLVISSDSCDPKFISTAEQTETLVKFFEMLESNR